MIFKMIVESKIKFLFNVYVTLSCLSLTGVTGQEIVPCSSFFENAEDVIETWYGVLTVPATHLQGVTKLEVTLTGNIVQGHGESLELVKDASAALEDAANGRDVQFKVNFPAARGLPTVQVVRVRERILCGKAPSTTLQSQTLELTTTFQTNEDRWLQDYKFNDICGTTNITNSPSRRRKRVVNGVRTAPGEFPWLAALYKLGSRMSQGQTIRRQIYICSAVLVSDRHAMTVAHCVEGSERVYVELGIYNRTQADDLEYILRRSQQIVIHPEYRRPSTHANIAIVKFERVKDFTERIRPICLWPSRLSNKLSEGTVVGWGYSEDEKQTDIPYKVQVDMVSQETCLRSHPDMHRLVSPTTFCAGGKGQGPCRGDSGAGFYVKQDNRWYLRGLVSTSLVNSDGTCNIHSYAIYTDMVKYLDWFIFLF